MVVLRGRYNPFNLAAFNARLDHGLLLGLTGQGAGGGANDHGLGSDDSPAFVGATITGCSVLGLNSAVFQPTTDTAAFFQVKASGGSSIFKIGTVSGARTTQVGTLELTQPYIRRNTDGDRLGFYSSPTAHHGASFVAWGEGSTYPGYWYFNYGSTNTDLTGHRILFRRMSLTNSFESVMALHDSGGVAIGQTYAATDPGNNNVIIEGNLGVNDVSPGERLDIGGNANVTGVYKVDDVQVVSNRVVDARCDDAINSGDATTDGVIDALRDAMITHGLIAAA